jgi:hypothetical protein
MEFSLGRDTLPSQARSVRGESRRLRRERDNAKKLLSRCLVRRVAQRDRAVAIMRPAFSATGEPPLTLSLFMITCQGTTQARKSNEPVSISAPARAHTCPWRETSNRRREPPFAPSPLAPQPDGLVRIISMAVRDHASLVTHSNHKLVGITVIKPSQRRICPTMLALTSHYSATNAKHPRYAPGLSPESMTRCDHWARYWCEKRFAAELGAVVGRGGLAGADWRGRGRGADGVVRRWKWDFSHCGTTSARAHWLGCRNDVVGVQRRLA